MKIIFVRHGNPNYKNDCLTELGHLQAAAAAERLKREPIKRIYSSTNGRAYETAQHINVNFGLKIEKLDFMRELTFITPAEGKDPSLFPDYSERLGNPWNAVDYLVADGTDIHTDKWEEYPIFAKYNYPKQAREVGEAFDAFLSGFGIQRCGLYYRVSKKCEHETILIASHAGSFSAVFAHVLNLPLSFITCYLRPDHTSITAIEFKASDNPVAPTVSLFNDAEHIKGIETAEMKYN